MTDGNSEFKGIPASVQLPMNKIIKTKRTSRERPKSAPYLRLKIKKGDPSGFVKLQLVAKNLKKIEGGTLWRHEKIFQKNFLNEIFEQCHSAEM